MRDEITKLAIEAFLVGGTTDMVVNVGRQDFLNLLDQTGLQVLKDPVRAEFHTLLGAITVIPVETAPPGQIIAVELK